MGGVSTPGLVLDGARYRVARAGSGPPVLLLHGFTGAAEAWEPWLGALANAHEVIAPDLLGHGGTDAPEVPARYAAERQVADLAAALDDLGIGRAAVVGYSMGARLALAFAAAHPGRVERLVLESGSPGIAGEAERAGRRAADEALARRIERDGMAAFVEEWERLPLFAAQARLPEEVRRRQREQRLANRPQGLAASLRGFGQGVQPALHAALPGLAMPVLLVAGAEDDKYARLAREMAEAIPGAELEIIDGAGHVPHLEQPERFRRRAEGFLGAARRARAEG
ncbi:MAG: 2-succinyl-6-hydroxy-2,4-cyclohexadiene-1-carboxylate synthase [Chloroflexota bacterium]